MVPYAAEPLHFIDAGGRKIASFVRDGAANRDAATSDVGTASIGMVVPGGSPRKSGAATS